MKNVKKLKVTVTYDLELSNLKIPENVYEELIEAAGNVKQIHIFDSNFPNAKDWLSNNILEDNSMNILYEIEDIA